jgi:hypothetical protein
MVRFPGINPTFAVCHLLGLSRLGYDAPAASQHAAANVIVLAQLTAQDFETYDRPNTHHAC